jgi:hypothetical protein
MASAISRLDFPRAMSAAISVARPMKTLNGVGKLSRRGPAGSFMFELP